MMEILVFICVGIFTGLSAGLLGVGGGIVSVPAMVILLPYFDVPQSLVMHIAIATSLLLIIPTSIVSAYSHSRNNAIVWPSVVLMLPGLIAGGLIGAYAVILSERELLQTVFSILLFLIAMYMLFGKTRKVSKKKTVKYELKDKSSLIDHFFSWGAFIIASLIGAISSLMGVGGGTMTVPYLVWRGITLPNAIGTSAFCGLPIAVSSSLLFFLSHVEKSQTENPGFIYLPAFSGILIGAMIFTPIGAKLTHRLDVLILKKVFVVTLLAVSVKLLFS